MSLLSAVITLVLVMDPLGNVPLFVSALRGIPKDRAKRVIVRELLIALLILVIFLFIGRALLSVMNISNEALNVGGGLILMMIAIQMIFPVDEHEGMRALPRSEPFIVPLAVPYTVGPSVLATAMLLMSQNPDLWYRWLAAVVIAWLITAIVLSFSANIRDWLGDKGVTAMERLMGMILVFLASQMLMTGIRDFFQT